MLAARGIAEAASGPGSGRGDHFPRETYTCKSLRISDDRDSELTCASTKRDRETKLAILDLYTEPAWSLDGSFGAAMSAAGARLCSAIRVSSISLMVAGYCRSDSCNSRGRAVFPTDTTEVTSVTAAARSWPPLSQLSLRSVEDPITEGAITLPLLSPCGGVLGGDESSMLDEVPDTPEEVRAWPADRAGIEGIDEGVLVSMPGWRDGASISSGI